MRTALPALLVVMVAAVLLAGCGTTVTVPALPAAARTATATFLSRYVAADGRVVRRDQGGDTVSEGEAYALLLDVAARQRGQFGKVWDWSVAHLMEPDGLLAYHWSNGAIADVNSATDADLDVARALILAGHDWRNPSWTEAGKRYAQAILTNESVLVGGRLWLVAGPWARTAPYALDPSYYDPATFSLLASTTGNRRWQEVAPTSAVAVAADTTQGRSLPTDWAQLSATGTVTASAPPNGGPIVYGYDAFRTLVRQDDVCAPGPGVAVDAALYPLARRTASLVDRGDTYVPDGSVAQPGDNPLVAVAAAGAAAAAGDHPDSRHYLRDATVSAAAHPSYYLDAWVALGDILTTTRALTLC